MGGLQAENFEPLDMVVKVYTLERPELKAIAFAGPELALEKIPISLRCKTCTKDWTYFTYEELSVKERERFELQTGDCLAIQILGQ